MHDQYGRPIHDLPPPPTKNGVGFLGGIIGAAGLLIVVFVFAISHFNISFGGGPGSGGGNADAQKPLPIVSIKGAKPCVQTGGGRKDVVQLTTPERVATCVAAKKYAKAILVNTYKSKAEREFKCLDNLWTHESGWSAWAVNPSSKAYGIAQLLPSAHTGKLPQKGAWKAQVDWGLNYINHRKYFTTPCGAWKFWLNPTVYVPNASKHWY